MRFRKAENWVQLAEGSRCSVSQKFCTQAPSVLGGSSQLHAASPVGASVLLTLLRSIFICSWAVHVTTAKSHLSGTISVSRIVIAIQFSPRKGRSLLVYRAMNGETSSEGLNDSPSSHTVSSRGSVRLLGLRLHKPVQGTEFRSWNSVVSCLKMHRVLCVLGG